MELIALVTPNSLSQENLNQTNLPENAKVFLLSLKNEYNNYSWRLGTRFKYRPEKTIIIDKNSPAPWPYFALLTLHELGHALSSHKDHKTDVERLKIESEAWQRAKREIDAHENWGIEYDEEFAEYELDSYRDWLHQKSKCKKCGLTRYQTKDGIYHCPECDL
jgi:hypothetical protein